MNVTYYIPQIEDPNYLSSGLDLLYAINRSFNQKANIKSNKKNIMVKFTQPVCYESVEKKFISDKTSITDSYIFNSIISNDKILVKKFDDNNYLTINQWPYESPLLCTHLVFWTLNNLTHNDVLMLLINLNIINDSTEYIIWLNSSKAQSIKTIKHYQILIRPKIFNHIQNNQITKRKLRKMIIVARHGPREPIHHLSKLTDFKYSISKKNNPNSVTDAQLTKQGSAYCYNFGTYIKQLYGEYFDFSFDKTAIISTNVDRTINSANQFIQGMFFAKDSFSEEPVALGHYTKKPFSEEQDFDSKIRNKIELSNDLIGDITMSLEDKKEYEDYHKLIVLQNRSDEFDKQIYNILGHEIKGPKDYFNIHSTLQVYNFHKEPIPIEWTEELNDQLNKCAQEYYYKLFNGTKFCSLFTDLVLEKIKTLISNNEINFAYLSTHDVTIYPLALRIAKEEVELPYYCSSVRYELWDQELRVYYDDVLICNKLL